MRFLHLFPITAVLLLAPGCGGESRQISRLQNTLDASIDAQGETNASLRADIKSVKQEVVAQTKKLVEGDDGQGGLRKNVRDDIKDLLDKYTTGKTTTTTEPPDSVAKEEVDPYLPARQVLEGIAERRKHDEEFLNWLRDRVCPAPPPPPEDQPVKSAVPQKTAHVAAPTWFYRFEAGQHR